MDRFKNFAYAEYFFNFQLSTLLLSLSIHNNICISDRSKLRVERTRKSLVRKSRVLGGFCYMSYTQRITLIAVSWRKQTQRKRTPFALQKDSFCLPKRTLLHSKCSRLAYVNGNFGSRKVPFCDKNGAISAPSTHKNATRNL